MFESDEKTMLVKRVITLEIVAEVAPTVAETTIDKQLKRWFERLSISHNAASDENGGWITFKEVKAQK